MKSEAGTVTLRDGRICTFRPAHPDGSAALAMEGGTARGVFTRGVTDVLPENGITFDGAAGISVGAGFGCGFKPGRKEAENRLRDNGNRLQPGKGSG